MCILAHVFLENDDKSFMESLNNQFEQITKNFLKNT